MKGYKGSCPDKARDFNSCLQPFILIEETAELAGADSLACLSAEGMLSAIGMGSDKICTACFTGNCPMELPEQGMEWEDEPWMI